MINIMEKHLVTIEFRYSDAPNSGQDFTSRNKTITLGVFDTFDEAAIEGNKAMEIFEKHFKLNPYWNRKDRFSKNGGCFGYPNRLITPLGYLQTSFDFYANITTLKYEDVEKTILDVVEATKRYQKYKSNSEE